MRRAILVSFCSLLAALVFSVPFAVATPSDSTDFGDAPEGPRIYYNGGPTSHFPSCLAPSEPGFQWLDGCEPRSTVPGATGFIKHVPSILGHSYWLGCNSPGIDFEVDAKNRPLDNQAACSSVPGDCVVVTGYDGMSVEQDECSQDDVDSGVPPSSVGGGFSCTPNLFHFFAYNAGETCVVYLNLLIDLDMDGDWNDAFQCCGYEWAVKNAPIQLVAGCNDVVSPSFPIAYGPFGIGWARITLTDNPVDDDFPWKGSAGLPGDAYSGGETEDHLVGIDHPDPVVSSSWGKVKILYR